MLDRYFQTAECVSQFRIHHGFALKLVVRLQKGEYVAVNHALLVNFLYQLYIIIIIIKENGGIYLHESLSIS